MKKLNGKPVSSVRIRRSRVVAALLLLLLPIARSAEVIEFVDSLVARGENLHYGGSRDPLLPAPMTPLPLGSVRPEGWLKHQLELMAAGQVGHLDELSPFLTEQSGWLGGDERGWEEAGYWFRGFYDLAWLTGDERLRQVADRWIEALVASQDEDGYYGSRYNRLVEGKDGQRIVDLWPQMVMNDALISHHEATRDPRVIPLLTRFFAFCRDLPDEQFLPQISWDYYENYREHFGDWKPRIQMKRAGDFVPQLLWLYNRTGEAWMPDLAVRIHHRTQPPLNQWLDNHTVHFSQRFRYPAQMYPVTGDGRYLRQTELFYDLFYEAWGQMPRGAHAADERIRMGKIDPRQAIETCALAELNKSHYILSRITGRTLYADRIEDITFNHLPASHAPDHRSLRYLTACNMPCSVPGMDFKNSGPHPVFAADMHRCCQHNTAMAWPWFVKNLWQATPDNGLIAWLHSPNTVTAAVGDDGTELRILTRTSYPFGERVRLTLSTKQPVSFPLYLRVPGWCRGGEVAVAGEACSLDGQAGRLIRINRRWQDGDRVELQLGMEVGVTSWPRTGALTVDRGPLSYSVRIKTQWDLVDGGPAGWPRWSLSPESPWNYGLAIDPADPASAVSVQLSPAVADQPWREENAPVVLKVPARRIPEWKASFKNTVDAVREGPVRSDEPLETIEMIPLGCAHLRMSVLPWISGRRDARYWQDIPDPGVFMLDRLE